MEEAKHNGDIFDIDEGCGSESDERDGFIHRLYRDYFFHITEYCTALLNGDEAAGADCAHAAFDEAIKNEDKLKSHPNIIGWLKRTANFRVKRAYRDRGTAQKRLLYIDDTSDRYIESLQYIEEFDTESEMDVFEIKDDVLECLAPDERELYELRFVKNLTLKQCAKVISLSESATRMRLVRIELKLRQQVSLIGI